MFEIDKKKFGSFVAGLRKEKHWTQKELAERLFLSDKAVSKWETGGSLPDTVLLIPLAELLGVTVTELLTCRRMPQSDSLRPGQVEEIVKAAITFADGKPKRAWQEKIGWTAAYGVSVLLGCTGLFFNYWTAQPCLETLTTVLLLCIVFGAYFCCFVKTRLPAFYDENAVNIFYDGAFRMNLPGMRFNNRNWPHIIRAARRSICLSMAALPAVSLVLGSTMQELWAAAGNCLLLAAFLCGLFAPVYLAGKKYA